MTIENLAALIVAVGALGTASFALVDATKAAWGGVSQIGYGHLLRAFNPFSAALDAALGNDPNGRPAWRGVLRAHWINGRARADQKAIVRSLIHLGLTEDSARRIAPAGHVDPEVLAGAVAAMRAGAELSHEQADVLGRLDVAIDAQMDAAFDMADQQYRNFSRVAAGVVSVVLSFVAFSVIPTKVIPGVTWPAALLVGLLAVPFAPIAKDLTSTLQAAATAVKAVKG